jgi:5'-3' exonuclease
MSTASSGPAAGVVPLAVSTDISTAGRLLTAFARRLVAARITTASSAQARTSAAPLRTPAIRRVEPGGPVPAPQPTRGLRTDADLRRVAALRSRSGPGPGKMAGVGALMLLDAASLYYRAFYGVPEEMTAPDGTPVNAVRGLLDMITRLVRARRPAALIACMDADWRPAFRVAAVPSYKAHRANPDGSELAPDTLTAQVPVIEEVLAAAGVAMAAAPGYEADDVIGTLATGRDGPVEVVTGDRDLFQLVNDADQVRVVYTARGLARLEILDEAAVTAKYQIPGRAYAAFALLRGDPSDGLPGVPGVGEKTAAALVRVFGTADAILTALDAGHGGFPMGSRAKLAGARDYLEAALPVVRVATDVPLPPVDGRLPTGPADPVRLAELDQRWDLGSSLGRMCAALAARPD